jgi:hypothetical protein
VAKESKDLIHLIHAETFLALFKIAYEAQADAGTFREFLLSQAERLASRFYE